MESTSWLHNAFSGLSENLTDMWQEKFTASVALSGLGTLFGVEQPMIVCLAFVVMVDLIVGTIRSFKERTYHPLRLSNTVSKVIAYISSGVMVGVVSAYVSSMIGVTVPIAELYITYLIAIEGISILRNLQGLGVTYPPLVTIILEGYRHRIEDKVHDTIDPEHKYNLPESAENTHDSKNADADHTVANAPK